MLHSSSLGTVQETIAFRFASHFGKDDRDPCKCSIMREMGKESDVYEKKNLAQGRAESKLRTVDVLRFAEMPQKKIYVESEDFARMPSC